MKKKLLLAAAAISFGLSLNVTADTRDCSRACSAAYHYCNVDYDANICGRLLARCNAC